MRILGIGDLHAPSEHPGYMPFCMDLYQRYDCDTVVFIGDVVDWHSVSFHAHHPEAPGPKDEYEQAAACVARWHTAFPKARVCIGNHDARLIRLAETVNIPAKFLRSYADIWKTPGWEWADQFVLDDVFWFHGTGTGGLHPAFNSMKKMLMSVVQGHIHTAAGISWLANPLRRIFGMDLGTGIDSSAIAFAYGEHLKQKAIVSAGVVIDGVPHHEVAPIGPREKYHKSRFTKGKSWIAKAKTFSGRPSAEPSGPPLSSGPSSPSSPQPAATASPKGRPSARPSRDPRRH